ncbi:hypothetical protein D4764_04G0011760 [Takifugu flavidus]|uniref:Uncharacterized protein n=1 Tax=Takifugu flavidus TaxID=433684 RepID=A0A5C6N6K2_9TELE|nr:hypothetical protein D4764_04G0011760 [Takifugu flavidus]
MRKMKRGKVSEGPVWVTTCSEMILFLLPALGCGGYFFSLLWVLIPPNLCSSGWLQKMGCSCSTSSDEWSDSDSDSSLSELPPFVRRSTKTVELRQHTSAGTQHACLDEEVKERRQWHI